MTKLKKPKQVLVFEKSQQFWTNSIDIASNFKKPHRDVMRAIKNLSCSDEFRLRNFAQSDYKSSQGKRIKTYNITRDGFSFLVMGFTGKNAALWKERYIKAFNKLAKAYVYNNNPERLRLRTEGKRIRNMETDAIKAFIEYAKENGSTKADWYYIAFTNMQNQLLFIIDKGLRKPPNVRDELNIEQLFQIGTADQLISKAVLEGIYLERPYKEIFRNAKSKVKALAGLVGVSEVPAPESMLGHNSRHMVEEEDAATSPSDDN